MVGAGKSCARGERRTKHATKSSRFQRAPRPPSASSTLRLASCYLALCQDQRATPAVTHLARPTRSSRPIELRPRAPRHVHLTRAPATTSALRVPSPGPKGVLTHLELACRRLIPSARPPSLHINTRAPAPTRRGFPTLPPSSSSLFPSNVLLPLLPSPHPRQRRGGVRRGRCPVPRVRVPRVRLRAPPRALLHPSLPPVRPRGHARHPELDHGGHGRGRERELHPPHAGPRWAEGVPVEQGGPRDAGGVVRHPPLPRLGPGQAHVRGRPRLLRDDPQRVPRGQPPRLRGRLQGLRRRLRHVREHRARPRAQGHPRRLQRRQREPGRAARGQQRPQPVRLRRRGERVPLLGGPRRLLRHEPQRRQDRLPPEPRLGLHRLPRHGRVLDLRDRRPRRRARGLAPRGPLHRHNLDHGRPRGQPRRPLPPDLHGRRHRPEPLWPQGGAAPPRHHGQPRRRRGRQPHDRAQLELHQRAPHLHPPCVRGGMEGEKKGRVAVHVSPPPPPQCV
jgi:hypothetical protein